MVVVTAREVGPEAAVTRTRGTGTDPRSAWRSPQRDWLARLFDGYRYAIEAATDSRPRLGRDPGITERLVRSGPPRRHGSWGNSQTCEFLEPLARTSRPWALVPAWRKLLEPRLPLKITGTLDILDELG